MARLIVEPEAPWQDQVYFLAVYVGYAAYPPGVATKFNQLFGSA